MLNVGCGLIGAEIVDVDVVAHHNHQHTTAKESSMNGGEGITIYNSHVALSTLLTIALF